MDKKTALQIISEAMNIAIAKGCFGLVEVTNIVKAVEFLSNQPDVEFGAVKNKEVHDLMLFDEK